MCGGTWTRLWSVSVNVGTTDHWKECGAVEKYRAPQLIAQTTPDPIRKDVMCPVATSGDRIRFIQQREGERIMISEIEVYGTGIMRASND